MIDRFRGNYLYLSNMYACKVVYDGMEFRCSEAAFQAAKVKDKNIRKRFTEMDGYEAKKEGRKVKLREDWNEVKLNIMGRILLDKFVRNPELGIALMKTGNELLIEGNNWGDRYWGVCNGVGENNLGKLLMRLRKYLINECKGS